MQGAKRVSLIDLRAGEQKSSPARIISGEGCFPFPAGSATICATANGVGFESDQFQSADAVLRFENGQTRCGSVERYLTAV